MKKASQRAITVNCWHSVDMAQEIITDNKEQWESLLYNADLIKRNLEEFNRPYNQTFRGTGTSWNTCDNTMLAYKAAKFISEYSVEELALRAALLDARFVASPYTNKPDMKVEEVEEFVKEIRQIWLATDGNFTPDINSVLYEAAICSLNVEEAIGELKALYRYGI